MLEVEEISNYFCDILQTSDYAPYNDSAVEAEQRFDTSPVGILSGYRSQDMASAEGYAGNKWAFKDPGLPRTSLRIIAGFQHPGDL